MVERRQVKAGDFLVSGPPAQGVNLTKVFVAESVEDIDDKFDEAARLQALLAKTKAAIEALKTKPT